MQLGRRAHVPPSRITRARPVLTIKNGNCVLAILLVFFAERAGTLESNVLALESIMLATFVVLWPFAAASLFALARFFDQRDQQLAKLRVMRRR
ncbi:hypothetical protein Bphy_2137 [Paraburkholderia phymatum STM815]|uniref:Transmembrane protein n=2 Tax=Paraburkholderia phymatum TaxID=148447 RepID=B2JEA4_PARP8|nr:hypothetical protein Bphy_2137 [Paraburkholderia phymatum STM815]